MNALKNTVFIGVISAVIATIFGTFASIGIFNLRKRVKRVVSNVNQLPIINSEIVVAVSLMVFFVSFKFPEGYLRLILGHISFCTPYVILSIMPRLESMDKNIYEAALDLGASPTKAMTKVMIPLLAPGILSGFVMSLTLSMDDFIITQINKGASGKVIVNVRDIYLMKGNGHEKKDLYIEGVACNGFENNYEYTITGDGRIEISHTVSPNGTMPKWLPRMGLKLVLNKELNQVSWYGRGPQENYPDRKTGYKIGQYSSTVQDMYEPYLMPQDYGLRTDNRWVRVTDESGRGLQFKMDELFNFNVYPFSTDNLTKAMYTYQLHPFEGVTMNLDYSTSGVGCTARSILGAYRTMPEKYSRKVVLQPL